MNNKGFGIQEMLVFIGLFMFILVAVIVYGRAKLSSDNNSITDNSNSIYTDSLDELTPVNIDKTSNEYKNLEKKLQDASKKYSFDKSNNIIVSLKKLQSEYLIGELIDSNNIKCDGYVIYNNDTNEYKPYINCEGMYVTENFNSDFLK